jgi:hypothetical protein
MEYVGIFGKLGGGLPHARCLPARLAPRVNAARTARKERIMSRLSVLVALALVMAGCARAPEPRPVDVMNGGTRTDVVFATTECTVKGPNGRCNVKTCKQDDKSNCQQFANACLATGHHYTGTAEAGT